MGIRSLLPLPSIAAIVLALATLAGAVGTARAGDAPPVAAGETVVIEMRIWQHVEDADNIWISARPRGGRWDTLGTIPFPLEHRAGGYSPVSKYRYTDLTLGGIGLRVWQPESQLPADRHNFFVQGCTASCPGRVSGQRLLWRPLGMIPLALDDGHSSSGRYRYGDLTVAVPRGNPGLLADREHLLALRDVLEGDGETDLDWSPSRTAADWEGVTVGGTPARVTGLSLSEHGLTGEIWGWLGDLTELTELRLDGNALTGTIPSKLSLLTQLTDTYLAGNDLDGCVPPPLRRAANHDLDSLGLPSCPAPAEVGVGYGGWVFEQILPMGSYWSPMGGMFVFDVPSDRSIQFDLPLLGPVCELAGPLSSVWAAIGCSHEGGFVLRETDRPTSWGSPGTWLVVDLWRGSGELERSHYSGCIYDCGADGSPAALIEQLIASVWFNTSVGEDREWVWP